MNKVIPLFTAMFAAFWLWVLFFHRTAGDTFGYGQFLWLLVTSLLHVPIGAALLLFASRGQGGIPAGFSVLCAPMAHLIGSQSSEVLAMVLFTAPACLTILLAGRDLIESPTAA